MRLPIQVFLTSPWIPVEWVRAHALEAHPVWSAALPDAPPLAAGVCAYAERVVRLAETLPGAAVVFSSHCDQLRRGFDAAAFRAGSRTFLFNLPSTTTSTARRIYRSELERLGRFLVSLGGTTPTSEALRREMVRTVEARRAPPTRVNDAGSVAKHAPLAVVGGPVDASHRQVLDALEAAGGHIVLDATENGERCARPQFDFSAAGDPFDQLADGYFDRITDVFQRPNTRLYSWLQPLLRERRARGIVLWHFTGCDLWRAEAASLRETFGLPVLLLEAGIGGVEPRELNRLQAFVETLQ